MDTNKLAVVKGFGFSDDPVFDALQYKLSRLADEWRETKDANVVRQYHTVLNCLLELGWDDELDLDAELPDELMPERYLKRYEIDK